MKYFTYCRKSSEDDKRQVPSIPSQVAEAERAFHGEGSMEIVEVLDEAQSAMWPGRPVFDEMLDRIERGDAEGIVAWAPNRLARNSVDAGRIVYLLDTGALKDIKFVTYTFQNTPEGKFMLQIMLSQSKYYSDALSVDVKRGQRRKLEQGWRPNGGPLGYVTDPETRTILPHPVHFGLIRQMFELALSGAYSARHIARVAREDWGLRTPKKRRIGGKPIGVSTIHRILTNPFYAGVVVWNGQMHRGKHQPVVTMEEFQSVRRAIGRPGREKPQRHQFAYTGMIRCGGCGLMVTAEHKVNRHGSRYLYYHCSRRAVGPRCREPAIEVKAIESQLATFLAHIQLAGGIEDWVFEELAIEAEERCGLGAARVASLETSLAGVKSELRELTSLRTRQLIDDEEFVTERERLRAEAIKLRNNVEKDDGTDDPIEPLRDLVSFSGLALVWFLTGGDEDRRLIVQTAGSNPQLIDKKISIQAAKPFRELGDFAQCPDVRRDVDDVRTLKPQNRRRLYARARKIVNLLDEESNQHILRNIRLLRLRSEDRDRRQAA